MSQRIVPFLWFDDQAEAAARFYAGLLPGSAVTTVSRYGPEGFAHHGRPAGSVMVAEFDIAGYRMAALNGGPHFRPTPALSYMLIIEDADPLRRVWDALAAGGEVLMPLGEYPWGPLYGWLNDRFGVSWQLYLGARTDTGGQAVVPSFLFTRDRAGQAEAAMEHYTAVFPDSGVGGLLRHDGTGHDPAGSVMHAQVTLLGEVFAFGDSAEAHAFGFTEGNSLVVYCDSQDEIDHYWHALSAVPGAEMCGWLKDRFGVSWQIVPREIPELMADPATAGPVMAAVMTMKKLDLAALKAAAAERLSAGQAVLDLGVAGPPGSEPLPITSSKMTHLWDGLCAAYRVLGFEAVTQGDCRRT